MIATCVDLNISTVTKEFPLKNIKSFVDGFMSCHLTAWIV